MTFVGHRLMNLARLCWQVLIVSLCAGCGSSDIVPLADVTGTVLLDGKPLAGATVTYFPDNGSPSISQTDAEGQYDLAYSSTRSGAVAGVRHTIRITTGQPEQEDDDGKPIPPVPERLPPRYNVESQLIEDVRPGSNTIDFRLQTNQQTSPPIIRR